MRSNRGRCGRILSANNKGSFFETRNNGYTGGFCRDVVWNTLIRRIHELVQNLMGSFDPLIKLLHIGSKRDPY